MSDTAKPLISIVDDDESVREATEALMKSLGFRARAFPSAVEFLASSGIEETDCIIADVNMPNMTGIEMHGELMERGRKIPTILITAYPDERVQQKALADGVVCYLSKPFDDEILLNCVRLALTGKAE